MTVAISLWIAVVACVMGCALPAIAGSQTSIAAVSSNSDAARRSGDGRTADIPECRHSNRKSPAPANSSKPGPNGAISCCPVEITLTQKWDSAAPRVAVSQDFVAWHDFKLEGMRFSDSPESVRTIWHSGRDRLLETHLLRI